MSKVCKHANGEWFDRSICPDPCGSMHYVCNDCGRNTDRCVNQDVARIEVPIEAHAAGNAAWEQMAMEFHEGKTWSLTDRHLWVPGFIAGYLAAKGITE